MIWLAEQLRDVGGSVTYLEPSEASTRVARARAEARGLENVTYVNATISEFAASKPDRFDYINCAGVLHHLEDPQEGLRDLASVLMPDGAMGVMVYGEHGRLAVTEWRKMIEPLLNNKDLSEQLAMTRKLLGNLPEDNMLLKMGAVRALSKACLKTIPKLSICCCIPLNVPMTCTASMTLPHRLICMLRPLPDFSALAERERHIMRSAIWCVIRLCCANCRPCRFVISRHFANDIAVLCRSMPLPDPG